MVALAYSSIRTTWVLSQIKNKDGIPSPRHRHQNPFESHLTSIQKDSVPFPSSQTPPAPSSPSPSPSSRISPAVLFIIVILAVIFFISGLLHLLVRFLVKKRPFSSSQSNGHQASMEASGPDALQRQLQQLFHLHDAGLDQAFIDALPVFLYREIIGTKEPFDCAVCLCEFAPADPLRLLPVCGHAFHLNCIDTWLLSNSTCPLCRGALFVPGLAIENPVFDFDDPPEEGSVGDREFPLPAQKPAELEEIVVEKKVFPVRLGKFRNLSNINGGVDGDDVSGSAICKERREEGESSSSNLDARRCYSMGSYQYILGDANLQVELNSGSRSGRGRRRGLSGNITSDDGEDGKRLCIASKGESFSVSKIWLWSNKKGKFPISSDADGRLPWMGRGIGDT